jgi:hypothetical protein
VTVKIQKHYRPELVVAKGKEPNPILTDPYLDAKESKLVSTNGHAMVVLPVETDKGERSRYLACSLLQAARSLGDEDVPAEIIEEEITEFGVLWPAAQERTFVDWQKVAREVPRRGDQGTTTIALNARLLKALAEAMGTAGGVALTFEAGKLQAPIRVEPLLPDPDEFGILMPIAEEGDDVDPDQRCPVCRKLLAAGAACPEHGRPPKPDDGSVGAAVSHLKGVLAEAGTTMTVRVGEGPAKPIGGEHFAKPKIDPRLTWLHGGEPFTQAATVEGGKYLLSEKVGSALFCARWVPTKGKPKVLAAQAREGEAKDACVAFEIERQADALLRNAGDGELTKADTKGNAVARKKVRR